MIINDLNTITAFWGGTYSTYVSSHNMSHKSWKTLRETSGSSSDSRIYPFLHCHFDLTETFNSGGSTVTPVWGFHNRMPLDSDEVDHRVLYSELWDEASLFVDFLAGLPDIVGLSVPMTLQSARLISDFWETEDVLMSVYVEAVLQTNRLPDPCRVEDLAP